MDRVTVYRFKLFNDGNGTETLAPRFATAKAIALIVDALPVVESAQVVDSHCVDCLGFLDDGHSPDAFRAGLKQAPVTELAMKLHGALLASGNRVEAERFAEGWLKDKPKDYGFQMHLGEAALARNDLGAAAQRFRSLLEVMPENPLLLNNLAWVAGRQKMPDAITLAEKANKLAPNQPAFMDTLAMLLADKGEIPRAVELLARAAELAPQAPSIRLNQARVLIKAGKKREARLILEDLAALGDKFSGQAEVEKVAQDL